MPAEELFGSMGKSMRHLLIMATILDDVTACTNVIRATQNMMMLMVFFVCIMVSSFTLWNMLLGILCEVVTATQNAEEEKNQQREIAQVMTGFFVKMDMNGDGLICLAEFIAMYQNKDIVTALKKLDINHR